MDHRFTQIKKLAKFAGDRCTQEEFHGNQDEKTKSASSNISIMKISFAMQGEIVAPPPIIDVELHLRCAGQADSRVQAATDEYPPCHHALLMSLAKILKRADQTHLHIIGGKAAAGYETAKDIIRLIYCVARRVNRDPADRQPAKSRLYRKLQCFPSRNHHPCRRSFRADLYRGNRGLRYGQYEIRDQWRPDNRNE